MFNVHIYIIAVNFISHCSYKVYMMPHDAVQVGSSLDFGSASRYFVTFLSERVGGWIFSLHFAFSDTWAQIFLKYICTCEIDRGTRTLHTNLHTIVSNGMGSILFSYFLFIRNVHFSTILYSNIWSHKKKQRQHRRSRDTNITVC